MYRQLALVTTVAITLLLTFGLMPEHPFKYCMVVAQVGVALYILGLWTGRESLGGYAHKGPPAEPPVRSVASDRDEWRQESYVKTLEAANRDLISRAIDSDAKADEWQELSERYKRELKARAETVEISGLEAGTAYTAETRA